MGSAPLTGRKAIPGYFCWKGLRQRCNNPRAKSYPSYGGRGITICERWNSFWAFLEDMGPRPSPAHSIERINNDGNYEPGNCRWATDREQSRNRRSSHLITMNGETRCLAEWCERFNVTVGHAVVLRRLARGWPLERVFSSGRYVARGAQIHRSKLDPENVRRIRALGAEGRTHRAIAKLMGLSHRVVGRVISRESWAHVP